MNKERKIKENLILAEHYAKEALVFGNTPAGLERIDLVLDIYKEVKKLMEAEVEDSGISITISESNIHIKMSQS